MSDSAIPSLASLRRRRPKPAKTQSLFDFAATLESEKIEADPLEQQQSLPEPPAPKIWTVIELLQRVRGHVERSYGAITVEGEVSNWRPASSGHCYFTLKDGQAQLAIVMFRQQSHRLSFLPKDGSAVRITGALTVYESRGQMQLVAERMEQVGLGALLAATRELKERLRAEGLFERKRPVPAFPRCIGVVTSLQGAALRDIVKVCCRRHAGVNLLVYPAAVQGPSCAEEVVQAIEWFSDNRDRVDVVLVARGGGSWEDLHGFDDERVARAIVACSVPVIVGVGHATDSTIADTAADVCAPTPSAAAEIVTAAQHRVLDQVIALQARLHRAARYEVLRTRQRLSLLSLGPQLARLRDAVRRKAQRVDELEGRLAASLSRTVQQRRRELDKQVRSLALVSPRADFGDVRQQVAELRARASHALDRGVRDRRWHLRQLAAQLSALSPMHVLERGYSLIQDSEGRVIRDAQQLHSGQAIVARLARGRVRARVEYSE